MDKDTHPYTNSLIHESSPYLLQHAHNPVEWYAWSEEALNKAKEENKMILVSVGYSACHWCHVMERESFEDVEVANYMNKHFVCIKVDREERPDVDQVYMNAVQLITGRGGWPLNCFALPDGRPFYGGTYFPKKNWLYLMENIVKEYETDPKKVEEYAENLLNGIRQSEMIKLNDNKVDYSEVLTGMTDAWKQTFDRKEGGPNRSPKFPLPNNYEFLLDYAILKDDKEILEHVELTLDKMAAGGIYDHLGGGFARYSTDEIWLVPHFEKMLYDNAQLVSLYSKAYRYFKKERYLEVMNQSLDFVKRELTGPQGEFYSALDADSEGEEGKFYVWTPEEIEMLSGVNSELIKHYYNIKSGREWEGHYILHTDENSDKTAEKMGIEKKIFKDQLAKSTEIMFDEREKRIHPGLDDKSLTSWNALMISGYCEAFKAEGKTDYLKIAEKNADLIWNKMHKGDGELMHNYKKGKVSIDGFLEDYAITTKAFIDLYKVGFEEKWLERASTIVDYTLNHFFDNQNEMFYFISSEQQDLVARKMEIFDNVIPSSNSIMANCLFELGLMRDNSEWLNISKQMLQNMSAYLRDHGSSFSNWGILMLKNSFDFYEVAISGKDCLSINEEMNKTYLPNSIFLGDKEESDLPLLENKFVSGKTMIYVCVDKTCQLPVTDPVEAISQIKH